MTNANTEFTGIPGVTIWVSAGEYSLRNPTGIPRIEVVVGPCGPINLYKAVTVTLGKPPKVLGKLPYPVSRQVKAFIELNRDLLLEHWNEKTSLISTVEELRRMPPSWRNKSPQTA